MNKEGKRKTWASYKWGKLCACISDEILQSMDAFVIFSHGMCKIERPPPHGPTGYPSLHSTSITDDSHVVIVLGDMEHFPLILLRKIIGVGPDYVEPIIYFHHVFDLWKVLSVPRGLKTFQPPGPEPSDWSSTNR